MDKRLAKLKMGLSNVSTGIELGRSDELKRSLHAAAEAFDDNNVKSTAMALTAVMDFLHDERLEKPFRFLIDVLDEYKRRGRATKPLEVALQEARLAATVDALMKQSDGKGLSLAEACKAVAAQTEWQSTIRNLRGNSNRKSASPNWQLVKNLRDNIGHGKARPEATEVYKYLLRQDWLPNADPPALMTGSKKPKPQRSPRP